MSNEIRSDLSEQEEKLEPLVPIQEREVDFYGDSIMVALVKHQDVSETFVPIKPLSDYLGLSWAGQSERIKRDEVLNEASRLIRVTRINLEKNNRGGKPFMLALPLKLLAGWLFGINAERVRPELREKIVRYRRECYDVLAKAFTDETSSLANDIGVNLEDEDVDIFASPARPPTAAEIEMEAKFEVVMRDLAQTREMGLTIARMAEQQIEAERQWKATTSKTDNNTARLDEASRLFGRLQRRVDVLESRLDPEGMITHEQSVQVSTSVKALAEYLTGRDAAQGGGGPRPNRYQGIFSELYRRFGVPNYQSIPLDRYKAVLEFLQDWKKAADLGDEELFLQGRLL